ncbi:tail tape measure protein [Novosphingobium colocasiae]|uniref:tail tape measure protein n=1 Tax=Novosphingobium colocasiae TaxID=1256513 RepID=UPI0035AFDCA4
MSDEIDSLLIDVRASTDGFARDIAAMRATVDGGLTPGFSKAGDVLERGLTQAIRRGSLGFEEFRRVAFAALDAIAAQSARALIPDLGGGSGTGGPAGATGIGAALGAFLGLPGRATGGNVAPGRAYVVGERGPEVFVPTSAGRVDPGGAERRGRDVQVAIQINAERGASVPQSLQRSSRQVASAVRRALVFGG